MTTNDLAAWLRAELADDREAIADKSATDWLVTLVETLVPLAVLIRLSAATLLWIGSHEQTHEFEPAFDENGYWNGGLQGPPIQAPEWNSTDSIHSALICALVPPIVWLSAQPYYVPSIYAVRLGSITAAWLGLNAAVLMSEPLRVGLHLQWTSDLRQWLRDELADDREAISQKTPIDWLVAIIDTMLPMVVLVRLAATSWVYAINHGKGRANINYSLRGSYAAAERWSAGDSLQTAVLCAWVPAMVYVLPQQITGPAWAFGYLYLSAAVLIVEPARVGAKIVFDRLSPL